MLHPRAFDKKSMAYAYFGDITTKEPKFPLPCNGGCGKEVKKPVSGVTNLITHITGQHADTMFDTYDRFLKVKKNTKVGPMNEFVPYKSVTPFAKRVYSWMDWVIMEDHAISFCENKRARKYSNINGSGQELSRKTLSKYIDLTTEAVISRIKKEMPSTFGIIFDGWSHDREHFIGIFATWTTASGGVVNRLLSCGVQDLPDGVVVENADYFGFGADDIGDYIFDVLAQYDRCFDHIEFICGDNCSVNGALVDKISDWLVRERRIQRKVPLVGCASHRFNLAVQGLYEPPESKYHAVVKKMKLLITELRTLKNHYKVCSKFKKQVLKPNETRWNSTHSGDSSTHSFNGLQT